MKTAIFVEGQTELILIRELLLKIFDYQNISLECYTLFAAENFRPTEYAFPNETASYHFQIVNVGNDNAVLQRLLRREKRLTEAGFGRIIGLRDMYSSDYREKAEGTQIKEMINKQFIDGHQGQIDIKSDNPDKIFFQFAIMEVEAWLLGMPQILARINENLTIEFIEEKLGFSLENLDPERNFFHPTVILDNIYKLVKKSYGKTKSDINTIASLIEKKDYTLLNKIEKCASFSAFFEAIPKEKQDD